MSAPALHGVTPNVAQSEEMTHPDRSAYLPIVSQQLSKQDADLTYMYSFD